MTQFGDLIKSFDLVPKMTIFGSWGVLQNRMISFHGSLDIAQFVVFINSFDMVQLCLYLEASLC